MQRVTLIIDEFQYAPNLLSYIKIVIGGARRNEMFENGEKVGTMYYLTGSQVFETTENVKESLAGRVGIIDLYPLSTREIYSQNEEIFIPDINILKEKENLKYKYLENVYKRIFR